MAHPVITHARLVALGTTLELLGHGVEIAVWSPNIADGLLNMCKMESVVQPRC